MAKETLISKKEYTSRSIDRFGFNSFASLPTEGHYYKKYFANPIILRTFAIVNNI